MRQRFISTDEKMNNRGKEICVLPQAWSFVMPEASHIIQSAIKQADLKLKYNPPPLHDNTWANFFVKLEYNFRTYATVTMRDKLRGVTQESRVWTCT